MKQQAAFGTVGNINLPAVLRIKANALSIYAQYMLDAAEKIEQQEILIARLLSEKEIKTSVFDEIEDLVDKDKGQFQL